MRLTKILFVLAAAAMAACSPSRKDDNATTAESSSTTEKGVYFVNLTNGEVVQSPVIVEMGVTGMTVEPAGEVRPGMGHHHLIVDGSFVPTGEMVPNDETHIHFGKGQKTDTLSLSPGSHKLTLQFANGVHDSYGETWSKTIEIMVAE